MGKGLTAPSENQLALFQADRMETGALLMRSHVIGQQCSNFNIRCRTIGCNCSSYTLPRDFPGEFCSSGQETTCNSATFYSSLHLVQKLGQARSSKAVLVHLRTNSRLRCLLANPGAQKLLKELGLVPGSARNETIFRNGLDEAERHSVKQGCFYNGKSLNSLGQSVGSKTGKSEDQVLRRLHTKS